MERQDLMIGDWVRNEFGDAEQVQEIGSGLVMLAYNDLYQYDDIQPIPLTGEILEKNFEKKGTRYGIFDDYFDFEVREYNDGMFIVNYHCCEMSLPDTQIASICHVHQLQHAMNICGVEKEITL